jgi:exosome complex protein LRP1
MEPKDATPKKRGVDEVDGQEEHSDNEVLEGTEETEPATKKPRVNSAEAMEIDSEAASSNQSTSKKQKKDTKAKKSKTKKEAKKAEKKAPESADNTDASADNKDDNVPEAPLAPSPELDTPQPKKRGRPAKKDRKAPKAKPDSDTIDVATPTQDTDAEATPSRAEERVTRRRNKRLSTLNDQDEESVVPTPDRAPKTRSETFSALLDGSIGEKQKKGKAGGRGGKRGGKGRGK